MNLRQRISLIAVSYPFITYAIAYLEISMNPYWNDNSPHLEYIEPADRWGWALVISYFYGIYGFPVLIAVIGIQAYLSKRQR
jgi:hypothetical protein